MPRTTSACIPKCRAFVSIVAISARHYIFRASVVSHRRRRRRHEFPPLRDRRGERTSTRNIDTSFGAASSRYVRSPISIGAAWESCDTCRRINTQREVHRCCRDRSLVYQQSINVTRAHSTHELTRGSFFVFGSFLNPITCCQFRVHQIAKSSKCRRYANVKVIGSRSHEHECKSSINATPSSMRARILSVASMSSSRMQAMHVCVKNR